MELAEPAVQSGGDVLMDAEQQEPERPPPSAASHGAEGDPREWTGAQVVANTDRLLLGSLDKEFADNPAPSDADWDLPDHEGPGPDKEKQPTDRELADAAPREWQPSIKRQHTTHVARTSRPMSESSRLTNNRKKIDFL